MDLTPEGVCEFLNQLTQDITADKYDTFHDNLTALGSLVVRTSGEDEGATCRSQLSRSQAVWDALIAFTLFAKSANQSSGHSMDFARIYRGILLLMRNLVASISTKESTNHLLAIMNHAAEYVFPHEIHATDMYYKTVTAYIEILVNASRPGISSPQEIITAMNSMFHSHADCLMGMHSHVPILLQRILVASQDALDDTAHNEFLYYLFKSKGPALDYVVDYFAELLASDREINQSRYSVLLEIAEHILSHESFGKYLLSTALSDQFGKWLKVGQVVIPYKDNWTTYQLTAILSWTFECLQTLARPLEENLRGTVSRDYELQVICTLDMLTELSKYESGAKFLVHYNMLPLIVEVFASLHRHIQPITLKNKGDATTRQFPHAKSMLVEIIAAVCHENFEQQEKLRQLHGLELVLSNCIIDDNNPFLKERCIVCLKFVLANNHENKKFVADLEAQGTANDEVLRQVGYQVEVNNGKVTVKKLREVQHENEPNTIVKD